jgi:hypothetical protein
MIDFKEAKQMTDLAVTCAYACVTGADTVTLTVRGMKPQGFPRGELLSVGTDGSKNYAVDPIKALAWLRSRTRKTHND